MSASIVCFSTNMYSSLLAWAPEGDHLGPGFIVYGVVPFNAHCEASMMSKIAHTCKVHKNIPCPIKILKVQSSQSRQWI